MSSVPPPDTDRDSVPPVRLGGTGQTEVWRVRRGGRDEVVKRAPLEQANSEALALSLLAGTGVAPALIAATPGQVISEFVAGTSRPARSWAPRDAETLGALLARTHTVEVGAGLSWPGAGRGPTVSVASIGTALGPGVLPFVRRAAALVSVSDSAPAACLHGDPWSGNAVWTPRGPVLVDWEFARTGDPAEDLAYLAAMDELAPDVLEQVLAGYGADAGVARRVARWRPLMALWCAAWFSIRGPARSARLVAHATRVIGPAERA